MSDAKVQPICPACREALVKIIDARIRRMLEVGRGESEEALESEQAAAFHLVELQRVLRGEPTSGVFDDYGTPVTITGPLFDTATPGGAE